MELIFLIDALYGDLTHLMISLLIDSVTCSTVNSLPMGYPVLPQPSMATTGQPHMNAMGMSNCHVVNGVPASSNFHPMRMNSGNG